MNCLDRCYNPAIRPYRSHIIGLWILNKIIFRYFARTFDCWNPMELSISDVSLLFPVSLAKILCEQFIVCQQFQNCVFHTYFLSQTLLF